MINDRNVYGPMGASHTYEIKCYKNLKIELQIRRRNNLEARMYPVISTYWPHWSMGPYGAHHTSEKH